jgi:cytidylate kinase
MGSLEAVAIDGPAATGKNTIGLAVARALGWPMVDTGAMYRAITVAAFDRGIDPGDASAVQTLAGEVTLDLEPATDTQPEGAILLDGIDISRAIRAPEVDAAVSQVASNAAVRQLLVQRQRSMAASRPVVMVGRDIGTNVLPTARWKFYLDARPEIRAARRHADQLRAGDSITLEATLADLIERDRIDSSRTANPLRPAEDAIVVDTSDATIEQSVAAILGHIRAAGT